mmetsp:Transcript_2179/g.5945  ORF Transcript_2179/g.5945 Transcript_2179/m.5945 type:complete len:305 (-) Transcript_2179:2-916(-)
MLVGISLTILLCQVPVFLTPRPLRILSRSKCFRKVSMFLKPPRRVRVSITLPSTFWGALSYSSSAFLYRTMPLPTLPQVTESTPSASSPSSKRTSSSLGPSSKLNPQGFCTSFFSTRRDPSGGIVVSHPSEATNSKVSSVSPEFFRVSLQPSRSWACPPRFFSWMNSFCLPEGSARTAEITTSDGVSLKRAACSILSFFQPGIFVVAGEDPLLSSTAGLGAVPFSHCGISWQRTTPLVVDDSISADTTTAARPFMLMALSIVGDHTMARASAPLLEGGKKQEKKRKGRVELLVLRGDVRRQRRR